MKERIDVIKRGSGHDPDFREGDEPIDTLRRQVESMEKTLSDIGPVAPEKQNPYWQLLSRLKRQIEELEKANKKN